MAIAVAIDPAKLLGAARTSLVQEGPGRPPTTVLRRAVSSTYYALFHAISLEAAGHLMPNGTSEERCQIARSFNHKQMNDVCTWIAGRATAPKHSQGLVNSLTTSAVADVAAAFIDLQAARHNADYDHLTAFTKAAVLSNLDDAERAIRTLTEAAARDRQAFLTLIVLSAKAS